MTDKMIEENKKLKEQLKAAQAEVARLNKRSDHTATLQAHLKDREQTIAAVARSFDSYETREQLEALAQQYKRSWLFGFDVTKLLGVDAGGFHEEARAKALESLKAIIHMANNPPGPTQADHIALGDECKRLRGEVARMSKMLAEQDGEFVDSAMYQDARACGKQEYRKYAIESLAKALDLEQGLSTFAEGLEQVRYQRMAKVNAMQDTVESSKHQKTRKHSPHVSREYAIAAIARALDLTQNPPTLDDAIERVSHQRMMLGERDAEIERISGQYNQLKAKYDDGAEGEVAQLKHDLTSALNDAAWANAQLSELRGKYEGYKEGGNDMLQRLLNAMESHLNGGLYRG